MSTRWPSRSSIAGRLLFAFGALLALFGVAAAVVFNALEKLDAADAELAAIDRPKDAITRVAALIREQYIHQAHTIIESNRSHIGHYESIARRTREVLAALRALLDHEDDRRMLDRIDELVRKNHEELMHDTLPAVDAGDVERARRLHAEIGMAFAQMTFAAKT